MPEEAEQVTRPRGRPKKGPQVLQPDEIAVKRALFDFVAKEYLKFCYRAYGKWMPGKHRLAGYRIRRMNAERGE